MQFPAVNWHEGLFLQPHHFQAWDRHWTERVCIGEQWQSPNGYGVLEIAINNDALAVGFFQVDSLRCKTPGGAIIEWMHGVAPERRDLRPAFEANASSDSSTLDVFVGVPRLKLGNRNVDAPDHRNGSRFRSQCLDLPDELDAACVKPVEIRELNARILLSTDDLAGYDVLRIARVQRSDEDSVQMRLDASFIPPSIDCSASGVLRNQILSSICDLMQQYSEQFTKQLFDAGGSLHATTPLDVQRLLVLQAVNPAASVLRVLANSRGIHPLTLYIELSRIAGSLDMLHPQRVSKRTPAYDHENLGGIMFEIKRRILNAVESLQRSPYRQIMFVGNKNGMQLTLERSLFSTMKRWFVGVHRGEVDAEQLYQWILTGKLDWKLGSLGQVERLYTTRAAGVELKRCSTLPPSLPKGEEWVYFEIQGTEKPAWKEVEETGSLALRIRDSMIVDRDQLSGERNIQIQVDKDVATLQFALFGVT